MPNLSPEQMAQFQEMMRDPEKKAQMEAMAKQFGMGGMGGMGATTDTSNMGDTNPTTDVKVDEVD